MTTLHTRDSRRTLAARRALGAFGAIVAVLTIASCTSPSRQRETLQPRLAKLVAELGETVAGERLLQRDAVVAFYKMRDGRPAWDGGQAAASMREAIAGIDKDGLDPADYHLARLDTLIAKHDEKGSGDFDADLEILLTDAAAAMIDHARYGRVLPASLDTTWNVDPRKDAPPLAEALERVAQAPSPAEGLEKEKLDHFIYRGLKNELARLDALEQQGGWPAIPLGPTIKLGERGSRVALVRARLTETGELAADQSAIADSSFYDAGLAAAVKQFQERHRLGEDGRLGAGTLKEMNVPVQARIAQVRVGLERSRWVLPGLGKDFLLVNLPAFKAYLIRDDQNIWETRTQIGQEARQTPSFRARMTFLDFNPTWTVPLTILKEDVLGAKARPESVLVKKRLQVIDHSGKVVDPTSIDWKSVRAETFPYVLRQDAGEGNALGRVKFMFPNRYDIYLHDTPHRELFSSGQRTFSSGCIRIQDPIGLARILLAEQGYDSTRIDTVIARGKTVRVGLKRPIPVLIVYWTVTVGAAGEIHYAPDVYKRDPAVLAALGAAPRLIAGGHE